MALDATKWEIQGDKDIRYTGPALVRERRLCMRKSCGG